ncbi:hypothetical protein C1752_10463 [Acaryochloris thomasi RCC1774]|uniref:Uncharacterized protein n=1 Tax=Acaryochloris thomasi RCC1774 TaxID=1764569 RepID=A0A2W1J866_9CYAN|nr:hypothetical protein [Acaryochloris thomasi]PZD70613.1 hypothetical protein C1752_10463 [Acaryochloris thomasi RCC1774]
MTTTLTPIVNFHPEQSYPVAMLQAMEIEADTKAFVADLSDLASAMNNYLDIADGGRDEQDDLANRFQELSRQFYSITRLYGTDLKA